MAASRAAAVTAGAPFVCALKSVVRTESLPIRETRIQGRMNDRTSSREPRGREQVTRRLRVVRHDRAVAVEFPFEERQRARQPDSMTADLESEGEGARERRGDGDFADVGDVSGADRLDESPGGADSDGDALDDAFVARRARHFTFGGGDASEPQLVRRRFERERRSAADSGMESGDEQPADKEEGRHGRHRDRDLLEQGAVRKRIQCAPAGVRATG